MEKTMSNQDEIERLKRLRERQLQDRDPDVKQKVQKQVAEQHKRTKKTITLRDMLVNLPHKWQGVGLGALVGVAIWLMLVFVAVSWATLAGIAVTVVFAIVGFIFGQAFDVRDDLRDI
jgi:ElaB/YqjD/DUF883 family membrane-anchored ribosome-binding protein